MREADNIREVEVLAEECSMFNVQCSMFLLGFIFWPKSSRYVNHGDSPHDLRKATITGTVPMIHCKRVGVFVDEDIETVRRIADDYALDFIQLHGHESPEYCAQLKGMHLIKAISVSGRDDIATSKAYEGLVDYFLFDTKCPSVGGSGQQFDWSVLSAYDGDTPFLLSGGIGPHDAPRLRQAFALDGFPVEKCVGIDLNSRFELSPGLKDVNKLKEFIKELSI